MSSYSYNTVWMRVFQQTVPDGIYSEAIGIKPCEQYETEIANDDDLVLFLSKQLER